MEQTKFWQIGKLCFLMLLLITLSSWYSHVNLVEYKTDNRDVELSDKKASEVIKGYSNKKDYYYRAPVLMEIKRSYIPFVYEKNPIKYHPATYISVSCGC